MAKATVVGSLLAKLGIDTAEYDAGLDKAGKDAQDFGKRLRSTMQSSASYVAAAAAGIKGALLGIGFAEAARQIQETVAAVAAIGDEAKRSGLSIKAFQEWKYVAEQNRIGIDAMVDGFKELNLRTDEFIKTGSGSAADSFKRLGYSADELRYKLKDPSELMLEIIERVRQLDTAAQIRIFDELLGGQGGEQFVQLIGQGADGIRKAIAHAHELGRVLADEVVKQADETNRKFTDLMGTLSTWAQSEVVQFAKDIADAYADLKNIYDLVQRMRDSYNAPEDQKNETIQARINDIYEERLALVRKIEDERGASSDLSPNAIELGFDQKAEKTIDTLQAKIDALNAEEDRLIKVLGSREPEGTRGSHVGTTVNAPMAPLPPERPDEADKAYEAFTAKQQAEAEAVQARIQALREALMTEEEAEVASYEKRLENLKTWLENEQITRADYDVLMQRAQQEHTDKMAQIAQEGIEREMKQREQLVNYTSDILGSLATLSESFGKKGFIAAKAFGIAQAVINTAEGITKALAQGGMLGFAGAAAVAAAGAAQIATIARTNPGSSSRPSVNGGASPDTGSSSGGSDGGAAPPQQAAFLQIVGEGTFSKQQVIDLIGQINELRPDGYKIVVGT